VLWLATLLPACGAVPFYDGFDNTSVYGPGTNFLTPIHGWVAGSTNVVVTSGVFDSAPQSAQIVGNAILTNTVSGTAGQVVWTDCRVRPSFGSAPASGPGAGTSLTCYFTPDHYLAISTTNGGWQICSNTIWGGTMSTLPDNAFVRIILYQNYATSNSAVFVNSNLVAQDVTFYGLRPTYDQFAVQGGGNFVDDTTQYLDTVSFSNSQPADIGTDLNGDGVRDVDELAWYGYAMRTLVAATNAAYTNIQMLIDAARARDVLVVSNGTYAGNVTIGHPIGIITGEVFTVGGTLNIGTGLTVTSLVALSCGDLTVSNGSGLTVNGTLTTSNLTLNTGSLLSVSSNLTVQGVLNVATGAMLVVNGQLIGSNVTVSGGLSLSSGNPVICTNFTLGANVIVTFTNANVTFSHLSIGTGGSLTITNGTLSADGLVLTGTFTLDQQWGVSSAQSAIPFYDGFEIYQNGTSLNALGFRGWGESDTNGQIQSQSWAVGTNVAMAPGGSVVSNRLVGAGQTKVWTDMRIRPQLGVIPVSAPTNTTTCLMYFDTNGFVVVYNPGNGWNTCISNAFNVPVSGVASTGQWARITMFVDFSARTAAVFMNGELLREKVPFGAGALTSYSSLVLDNQSLSQAYLDEIHVTVTPPSDLFADINGNGINDFTEVQIYGSIFAPGGSIFTIR